MQAADSEPIVAFILAHYPKQASLQAMAHLGLDRLPLTFTPGLRFFRLLGVGKGRVFDPHADLQRYGLFTVWDSYAALQQFEQTSRSCGVYTFVRTRHGVFICALCAGMVNGVDATLSEEWYRPSARPPAHG